MVGMEESMRNVLITGGSRGIGRAAILRSAAQGWSVALNYALNEGLKGVVLNAGIVAQTMPLADMSAERLKTMFDVNVYGTYLCAREAARRLQPDSAIVVVSSMASRLGSPFEYVDYAGAKSALDTLTFGLSKELAPKGIRVNAVRPGLIDTDIHASGGNPDRAARLGAGTPVGRAGKAEEVAEAIFWLLNDAPAYVTGTFIDVAGGR